MKIGIAADHGGFALKQIILEFLTSQQHTVKDFGAYSLDPTDDYPDFVVPLGRALVAGEVERGIAICGSGVGASIAVNKIAGVRAALIHESFSAHQGVEDDNMNLICLGGRVTGDEMAKELIQKFLLSTFTQAERHQRRLNKVKQLENGD